MMKLVCLLVLAGVSLVFSTGGDFQTLNFLASAPYCYHHNIGGGAYNDHTVGKDQDTVESLEAQDFHCGDIISYMFILELSSNPVDAKQDLQMKVVWDADPTGQSGVGFGNLAGASVNLPTKAVENGNGFKNPGGTNPTQPAGGCLGKFGNDGGAYSNGNERVVILERRLTKPLFTPKATLEVTLQITNLEAGERVIVRADVYIYCLPGSRPTGNLQGAILWKVSMTDWSSISGGLQTVPLLGVGKIQGVDCTAVLTPVFADDFTASVTTYTPSGGIVSSFMQFSWNQGAYSLTNPGTGTYELHTFVTTCSMLHDGEYLYSQSACGCESTKIGFTQPQLFFNATGQYYIQPPVSMVEPYTGLTVNKYTAVDMTQYINYLYLNSAGVIVRADWKDGRIMIFTNVTVAPIPPSAFVPPATLCTCRRRTDIAWVLETSADTDATSIAGERQFAVNATRQFQVDSSHTQFAVLSYGATPTVVLGINAGNTAVNVNNAINSIQCGKSGCGTADGNVSAALVAAVDALDQSTRQFVGKVVIFVTNGWAEISTTVLRAVDYAVAHNVSVMVVSYQTIMTAFDLEALTSNPDYLLQRYTVGNLISLDPIDLTSRVCLINDAPCGKCCGFCDAACGTCRPVDTCPQVSGCATTTVLVGSCCVNVTSPNCPDKTATCEVGTCNAITNQCDYKQTCVAPTGPLADNNCYSYACNGTNGQCVKTPLFTSDKCVNRTCVNNAIVPTNTVCPTGDRCTTYSCNPLTGCVSASVPFTGTPANATSKCGRDVCDPAKGWVVVTQPGCVESCNLNCGNVDQCVNNFCTEPVPGSGSYACAVNTTTCTPPNLCYNATCDPAKGCQFTPKVCDDGSACTVDTCVVATGLCNFEPVVCTQAAGGLCSSTTCNNATGLCETGRKSCDDAIGCTLDACDPLTGQCVYTPSDELCNLNDPCQTSMCNATGGCMDNNITCPDDGLYCTNAVCVAFQGCNAQSIQCNTTTSSKDCSTVACVEEKHQCVTTKKTCSQVVTITVASLTAGVIAGIVIGVIAFIACAGGASYAAFQQLNTGGANAVVNNPLYKSQGKQGTNPLFQEQ